MCPPLEILNGERARKYTIPVLNLKVHLRVKVAVQFKQSTWMRDLVLKDFTPKE